MKKKGKYLFLAICTMCLTGCSLLEEEPSKMGQIQTESQEQIMENEQTETLKQVEEGIQLEEDYTLDLKDLMDMLGMKDEDTANLLGGGEENWTDDKSFYIGRIFQTDVYGDNYKIFTTLVSVTFFTKRERGDGGKQRTVYTDSIRK